MSYYDITMLYAGSLMDDRSFDEQEVDEMTEYIAQIKKDSFYDVEPVEIYGVAHEHPPLDEDEECVCVQYLTDHHPLWRNLRSRRDVHEQLEDWEVKFEANMLGLIVGKGKK